MKIVIILLLLVIMLLAVQAKWVSDKRLLASVSAKARGISKRAFTGQTAIGYFTLNSNTCPDATTLSSFQIPAKNSKRCWTDSTNATEAPISYVCVPDTHNVTIFFGDAGNGFILPSGTSPITIFDEDEWTVGKVPGSPSYTTCNAQCTVGYCESNCTATCNATCSDNDGNGYYIVPQSFASNSTEITNCGGQGACCASYDTDSEVAGATGIPAVNITTAPVVCETDYIMSDAYSTFQNDPNSGSKGTRFTALYYGYFTGVRIKLGNAYVPSSLTFRFWDTTVSSVTPQRELIMSFIPLSGIGNFAMSAYPLVPGRSYTISAHFGSGYSLANFDSLHPPTKLQYNYGVSGGFSSMPTTIDNTQNFIDPFFSTCP